MSIGEVCTRNVIVIHKDESIREAARLMREHHIGDVVVVEERDDGNFPIGILTDRDIVVELVAKDIDLDSISVGDAMSFELLTAREDEGVMETLKHLRSKGVRRVPVVGENGALVGILTVDDFIDLLAEQLVDLVGLMVRERKLEKETRKT